MNQDQSVCKERYAQPHPWGSDQEKYIQIGELPRHTICIHSANGHTRTQALTLYPTTPTSYTHCPTYTCTHICTHATETHAHHCSTHIPTHLLHPRTISMHLHCRQTCPACSGGRYTSPKRWQPPQQATDGASPHGGLRGMGLHAGTNKCESVRSLPVQLRKRMVNDCGCSCSREENQ